MFILTAIKTLAGRFLGTKAGRICLIIAGVLLAIGGFVLWLTLRDKRMMRKGADLLVGKQRKILDQRLDKREDDESDIGRMSDDALVDELRSDKRKPG